MSVVGVVPGVALETKSIRKRNRSRVWESEREGELETSEMLQVFGHSSSVCLGGDV